MQDTLKIGYIALQEQSGVSYGAVCYLKMRGFVRNIPGFQEVRKLSLAWLLS